MSSSNVLSYFRNRFIPQSEVPVQADLDFYRSLALGEFGIVTETIYPRRCGRVEYRASWWEGCCPANTVILAGTQVRIIEIINITLMVMPVNPPCMPLTFPNLDSIEMMPTSLN
jgi:membrane protein implicated in regulation of membrane protease activity